MAPTFKVGDTVVHVCTWPFRVIRTCKIVRETSTQWIDDIGSRWRKSDGERLMKGAERRAIISVEQAERETKARAS